MPKHPPHRAHTHTHTHTAVHTCHMAHMKVPDSFWILVAGCWIQESEGSPFAKMFIWYLVLFILWHLLPYFIFLLFGCFSVTAVTPAPRWLLIDITISFWCNFRLWLIFTMAGVKVIVDCKCLPSQPTGFYKLDVFARVYVCVSVWCVCERVVWDDCVFVWLLCQFSIIFQSFLLHLLMPKEDYLPS